jgi:hypothetical protein
MVTCYLKYILDSKKISEFEVYAKMWIPLVEKFGGTHHGYFLPHEGPSNIGYALFSFESLAAYEEYRIKSLDDPECIKAMDFYRETNCFLSFERSFMRPVLSEA